MASIFSPRTPKEDSGPGVWFPEGKGVGLGVAKVRIMVKYKGMSILLIVNHPSDTVDGRHPAPVEVGSLSLFVQVFLHPQVVVWDFFQKQYVYLGPWVGVGLKGCNTFFYDNTSQKMVDCLMRQPAVPHRFSGDIPTPENEHIP